MYPARYALPAVGWLRPSAVDDHIIILLINPIKMVLMRWMMTTSPTFHAAGHNVGGEGQEAPERLLAEVRVAQVHMLFL